MVGQEKRIVGHEKNCVGHEEIERNVKEKCRDTSAPTHALHRYKD